MQYFEKFETRQPPEYEPMGKMRTALWHVLAGATIGVAFWYLHWRWTQSLNPDAFVFSVTVATAETLFFFGTLLFFHDIWREGDTGRAPVSALLQRLLADQKQAGTSVDVFVTTYDEDPAIVRPSIEAAVLLNVPAGVSVKVWVLDDGNRQEIAKLAEETGVGYLKRDDNVGFKAGNLKNALLQTTGDFIVICDADTRVFPDFLVNTLGYFSDPEVAWVQTPHWFYDIPEGMTWEQWLRGKLRWFLPSFCLDAVVFSVSRVLIFLSGQRRIGADPFMSEPALFFDVIQRRRNRNGASFCCGAGSLHRREALFQGCMRQLEVDIGASCKLMKAAVPLGSATLQPFRFHVSEDIYTSILLHGDPKRTFRSVYHPYVESRMLSPWSMEAWATQKLKYAGGTFDVMLRDNPVFKRGMPWRTKLHYAATFWSYLSVLWAPVMMLAPVISLFTGWSPVKAFSVEFFAHILPVLLLSELAMVVGCKGHNINVGRIMAVGALPISLRAFWLVLRGQKPKFPATPKTPVFTHAGFKRVLFNGVLLILMAMSAIYGVFAYYLKTPDYSAPFLIVNLFWLAWASVGLLRVLLLAFWQPPERLEKQNASKEKHDLDKVLGIGNA